MQQYQLITQHKMEEMILLVKNHIYPFATGSSPNTKVQEIQPFNSAEHLQQKKVEMLKKSEIVYNPAIIRILSLTQQGMNLVYTYERVPHSLHSYLQSKRSQQTEQIWTMTKKLFIKKLAFQLTLLTSYLCKMKIQTELATQHLGVSADQKIKLYISPKYKMGIKQELSLILAYNQSKQKILKEVNQLFQTIGQHQDTTTLPPSNNRQTNKSTYPCATEIGSSPTKTEMPGRRQNYTQRNSFNQSSINLDTSHPFLRQTRAFKESNDFRKRKMSSGHFQFGKTSQTPKNSEKPSSPSIKAFKSPRDHKYSYQYTNPKPHQYPTRPSFPDQSSQFFQTAPENEQSPEEQTESDPSNVAKSKSIKIQLEQKQNVNSKRQRKDSYKVKITTVREYQMEGNPSNLFGGRANSQDDLFEYFAKRAQRQEQQQQNKNQDPQKQPEQEQQVHSQYRYRKQTADLGTASSFLQTPTSPTSPWSAKERKFSQRQGDNKLLEQRIREAKERTQKALNFMKALKK